MGRPKSAIAASAAPQDFVGTKDAAAILGVSVSSVQKLVNAGKLEAWRTDGGHRRISIRSLQHAARDSLPASLAAASTPPLAERRAAGLPLRVLVVEDNALMSRALAKQLERFGGAVRASFTTDAAEALLAIAEDRPDLVITDLAMQPFDGFHLIRVLRGAPRYRDMTIIVVTGLSEEQVRARGGVEAGVTVYRKPVSYERLGGFLDALVQLRGVAGHPGLS